MRRSRQIRWIAAAVLATALASLFAYGFRRLVGDDVRGVAARSADVPYLPAVLANAPLGHETHYACHRDPHSRFGMLVTRADPAAFKAVLDVLGLEAVATSGEPGPFDHLIGELRPDRALFSTACDSDVERADYRKANVRVLVWYCRKSERLILGFEERP